MGGVILLLMITVVLFIVLLFVERSHRKEPSHEYEQVFYNRTKLSTDIKIKHNAAYNATEDVTVDALYSTINEVPYTTDSSYAVPAMPSSKTSEDEYYDTVQTNECSDVEETVVKMDTNPSYGVSTGEDGATATDYQSSQQYDYDDVHENSAQLRYNMATTTTADVEEDIVQHKCTLDQRHDTKTTLVANSAKLTDEDKYGVINQPQCDDNSFDTTVDHNATTKSCLPLIMSGAKPAGEYGVINQPRCDDNSFDTTVDHNATTKSCLPLIMSGAKPAGEYGVINQPRCDDNSFDTTVDHNATCIMGGAKPAGEYGVINQPRCDDNSFDTTVDHNATCIMGGAKPAGEYGVINQPQCDDNDSTVDHNATTKSCIMSGAKSAGGGKYDVIIQPRCDDFSFNATVDQSPTADQSPTTKSTPLSYLPFTADDARSTDEDEYGVINQPQCDDPLYS